MHKKSLLEPLLAQTPYPDPADILCDMASPAEADMMRIIALFELYQDHIPTHKLKIRLNYKNEWDFYNQIFEEKWEHRFDQKHLTDLMISLQEKNPFAIMTKQKGKHPSPYHDLCNKLPLLMTKNGGILNLENARLHDIIKVPANLKLSIHDIVSYDYLKEQLFYLNIGDVQRKRYEHLTHLLEVKQIKHHAHFKELEGQRGVFARQDIPAGTVLGYYTGDLCMIGDAMPPLLCSWPVATYRYKLSFNLARHFIQSYTQWIDGYVLGNMLKLVNSAAPKANMRRPVKIEDAPTFGNTACYFGHFISDFKPDYITMPFYITHRAVNKGEEIMTYYPLS